MIHPEATRDELYRAIETIAEATLEAPVDLHIRIATEKFTYTPDIRDSIEAVVLAQRLVDHAKCDLQVKRNIACKLITEDHYAE